MVDVKPIKIRETGVPFRETDTSKEIDRIQIQEALRTQNIFEVLAKSTKFKVSDFMDFFKNQYMNFKSQIMQDMEVKSMEGQVPAPDKSLFNPHIDNAAMSSEEGQFLFNSMANYNQGAGAGGTGSGGKQKTMSLQMPKADTATDSSSTDATTADSSQPLTQDEMGTMADGTVNEWNQFVEDTWGQIFDAQMMSDYQKRMGEVQQEVQKIIALAKSGAIEPEYVLIALAKVNQTKNGCLMTWLGKKAFHINESLSKVANDLGTTSTSDPNYVSTLELGREKTRDGSYQLQLVTTDMQKVMNDVSSTMEFVHSAMEEINRTRREIITKVGATH